MNSLDFIIFIPILIGFILGLFKGLIRELTSLASIVLGVIIAIRFEPQVSRELITLFNIKVSIAQAISYAVIFITVAIVLLFASKILNKVLSGISLGGINLLLGGLFGALKYALVVSVFLNVFDLLDKNFNLIKEEKKNNSITYRAMLNLGPKVWDGTKEFLDQE